MEMLVVNIFKRCARMPLSPLVYNLSSIQKREDSVYVYEEYQGTLQKK